MFIIILFWHFFYVGKLTSVSFILILFGLLAINCFLYRVFFFANEINMPWVSHGFLKQTIRSQVFDFLEFEQRKFKTKRRGNEQVVKTQIMDRKEKGTIERQRMFSTFFD